ncbi:MAG: hypothetical protein J6125_03960 [Clostridia bacterium]|nr:hypothetical protein [Clostridia bacterium]
MYLHFFRGGHLPQDRPGVEPTVGGLDLPPAPGAVSETLPPHGRLVERDDPPAHQKEPQKPTEKPKPPAKKPEIPTVTSGPDRPETGGAHTPGRNFDHFFF